MNIIVIALQKIMWHHATYIVHLKIEYFRKFASLRLIFFGWVVSDPTLIVATSLNRFHDSNWMRLFRIVECVWCMFPKKPLNTLKFVDFERWLSPSQFNSYYNQQYLTNVYINNNMSNDSYLNCKVDDAGNDFHGKWY